ncbi:MAG: glycoside hydrolase family 3 C-terminal domain-containing protein, partial [Bifidobacteriaceae bacterium]|nr:glycoside hydrolase family 3 C-terminal domain-containing protein [Bifidobacteriaceae bacterium]
QISTAAHRAAAQASSEEGVVLLKNDGGVLPFASTVDDVVLLGEFGQEIVHGDYSPTSVPSDLAATSVKAALEDKLGAANVTYAAGTVVPVRPGIGALTFYDAGGAVLSQVFPHDLVNTGNPTYDGYAPNIFDGTGWGFPGVYFSDLFAAQGSALQGSVEFTVTIPAGTQQVSLLQYGEAPTPGGTFELSTTTGFGPATPVATIPQDPIGGAGGWFPMPVTTTTEPYTGAAGSVRLRVAYANTSAVGPQLGSGGAADPALSAAVAAADAVVVYVGTRTSDSAEEQDRASIALPRYQPELAAAACQANPNTVVYIQAVGEVDIRPFKDHCDAIIWSTYNGQDQGGTVPRILWGDANPSGKLPFTYYEDPVRDLEATVDYTMTPTDGRLGRTYQYFTGNVLYPFGYGLSYSAFSYANLALSGSAVTPNDTITASVDVTNTSSVAGKEVVELYASSPKAGDLLRPDKQLKGFEKIALAANETKTVSIELKVADLWFWDEQSEARVYDTGAWTILVGPSSETAAGLTATMNVTGTLAPSLDVVTAVPDGTVLNTITPDNAIHANLSATRTDQSFYDLSTIAVTYTSSDTQVASVDATGAVKAVGAGVAQITASVTADGVTKADTFPVVVYDGAFVAGDGTVLFDKAVAFPDQTITVDEARGGTALGARLAPATWGSDIAYSIAPMDTNTAGATVSAAGRITASKAGTVRVTAVASRDGKTYSSSATITVVTASTAALDAALTSAGAINLSAYTAVSAAALTTAIQAAQSVAANPAATQAQVDVAEAAVRSAIAGLVPVGQSDPLQALINAAQSLAESATVSASQAAALMAAVEAAQRVLAASAGASQADVAAAIAAINSAIAAAAAGTDGSGNTGGDSPATPAPDPAQAKAALASLVTTLATVDPSAYTDATWAAVKTALDAAKTLLANPNATAAQVGAAIQTLAAATAGLATAPPVVDPKLTPTLASVKAGQRSVTLVKGKAIKLAANGYLTDNSVNKVTWSSSKKSVATVSAAGRIVAKKAGSAKITAKVGGKSATITVKVLAKKPAKSAVTSVKATVPADLAIGASADIAASYSPATATSVKVTYASSATDVASVDSAGHLVAKAAGTATITVKAGGKSKAYTVTVK